MKKRNVEMLWKFSMFSKYELFFIFFFSRFRAKVKWVKGGRAAIPGQMSQIFNGTLTDRQTDRQTDRRTKNVQQIIE